MKINFTLFNFSLDSEDKSGKTKNDNKKSSKIWEILETLFISLVTSILAGLIVSFLLSL